MFKAMPRKNLAIGASFTNLKIDSGEGSRQTSHVLDGCLARKKTPHNRSVLLLFIIFC